MVEGKGEGVACWNSSFQFRDTDVAAIGLGVQFRGEGSGRRLSEAGGAAFGRRDEAADVLHQPAVFSAGANAPVCPRGRLVLSVGLELPPPIASLQNSRCTASVLAVSGLEDFAKDDFSRSYGPPGRSLQGRASSPLRPSEPYEDDEQVMLRNIRSITCS